MKRIRYLVTLLALAVPMLGAMAAEQNGLASDLRAVVEQNLDAYNRKALADTLASVHSKSPDYASLQAVLPDQFQNLDTRTDLVDFQYIGHDDEFAVARVKLRTTGADSEPFTTNVLDTIAVFYPEDGVWKYWSNQVLGIAVPE